MPCKHRNSDKFYFTCFPSKRKENLYRCIYHCMCWKIECLLVGENLRFDKCSVRMESFAYNLTSPQTAFWPPAFKPCFSSTVHKATVPCAMVPQDSFMLWNDVHVLGPAPSCHDTRWVCAVGSGRPWGGHSHTGVENNNVLTSWKGLWPTSPFPTKPTLNTSSAQVSLR